MTAKQATTETTCPISVHQIWCALVRGDFRPFTILARTAKSVTVEVHGKTVRRGVTYRYGAEQFKPFGSYSMAMVITANDTAERIAAQ